MAGWNPGNNLAFSGYKNVYGYIKAENEDSESLKKAMLAACPDCTGAMMQACVVHVLQIKKIGWNEYVEEMKKWPTKPLIY